MSHITHTRRNGSLPALPLRTPHPSPGVLSPSPGCTPQQGEECPPPPPLRLASPPPQPGPVDLSDPIYFAGCAERPAPARTKSHGMQTIFSCQQGVIVVHGHLIRRQEQAEGNAPLSAGLRACYRNSAPPKVRLRKSERVSNACFKAPLA
eukprot:3223404-Rhodomonas_salina.1